MLYRDLVQREISSCENVPNLWKTYSYVKYSADNNFYIHEDGGFGGYADWIYEDFDAKISFRSDHKDDCKTFRVGKAGLCIKCGDITTTGLYCDDCDIYTCWRCGNYTPSDEMVTAYDSNGEEVRICSDCADEYFGECEDCGRLFPLSCIRYLENLERNVCDDCLREDYDECDCCHEFHHTDYMNYGDYGQICDDCFDNYYSECEVCHEVHHDDFIHRAYDSDGDEVYVCEDCLNSDFEQCDVCGEYRDKSVMEDGVCPDCR